MRGRWRVGRRVGQSSGLAGREVPVRRRWRRGAQRGGDGALRGAGQARSEAGRRGRGVGARGLGAARQNLFDGFVGVA